MQFNSERFGSGAVLRAVTLAGLVSTNSAAVALASLVAAGQMTAIEGALPLAAALSANTAVRLWISLPASEPSYRWAVSGSLVAGWFHPGVVRNLSIDCDVVRTTRLKLLSRATDAIKRRVLDTAARLPKRGNR